MAGVLLCGRSLSKLLVDRLYRLEASIGSEYHVTSGALLVSLHAGRMESVSPATEAFAVCLVCWPWPAVGCVAAVREGLVEGDGQEPFACRPRLAQEAE
jgi:hypothetical protein